MLLVLLVAGLGGLTTDLTHCYVSSRSFHPAGCSTVDGQTAWDALWAAVPLFSLVFFVFFVTMLFPVFPPFLLADGFFLLCETLESTCPINVIPQPFLQIVLDEHQCFKRFWCHGSTVVSKHNPANTEQLLNNVIGSNNKA